MAVKRKARQRTVNLPPLPDCLPSPLGAIPVDVVDEVLATDKGTIMGTFDPVNRVIKIRAGMGAAVSWQTLLHEATHMVLSDAGVQLSEDQHESVCDAIATAGVLWMIAERS